MTIEGVVITPLQVIADERGAVLHMLRNDAAEFSQFGECYFSEVVPGAFKGWKRHSQQTQQLAVPVGRIRLIIYDDRDGSPSCGEMMNFELGRPDNYARVAIARSIWYGFGCLGSTPALLANCTDLPHFPGECEMRETYTAIPFDWVCDGAANSK